MSRSSAQQLLERALAFYAAGHLRDAETMCRQAISLRADDPDALSLLGTILGQAGKPAEAVDCLQRAILLRPSIAELHLHLANSLHAMGRLPEAVSAYRRGITLRGDIPEAYNNLGMILRELKRFDEAAEAYRFALKLNPRSADAHNNLGIVLSDLKRPKDAIAEYREAIGLDPKLTEAHFNLGGALKDEGEIDAAAKAYLEALRLDPANAEAHNNFGIVLCQQGRLDAAVDAFNEAVRLKPAYAGAYYNLANALRCQGNLDEALAADRQAIHHKPDYADAYNNLGGILAEKRQLDAAIASYRSAIKVRPEYAEASYNLGLAYSEQGKLEEAVDAYTRAIKLKKDYTAAHQGRGNALTQQGKLDEAIRAYEQATIAQPEYGEAYNALGNAYKEQARIEQARVAYEQALQCMSDVAFHSNLIFALHFHPDYDAPALYAEARRWHEAQGERFRHTIQPHRNVADPDRRLRIGYLSVDFNMHPVGWFVTPLLRCHDHSKYEIYCYSDVRVGDSVTDRLKSYANVWRSTVGLPDDQVARLIREDQIDILIELTAHTAGHRLIVFAQKPAPVQITYLGYCSTTGLRTIDYRLSDPYMDPVELAPGMRPECIADDRWYTEKTLRLPDTYFCYEPLVTLPTEPPPAQKSGHITFGSLNNFAKVGPGVQRAWRSILQAVPNSRLIISTKQGSHRQSLLDVMQEGGVETSRIVFVDRTGLDGYFKLYNSIDICLDPFPFNGGTTSCDSLWMGVPFVTLRGRTAVGRAGASLLSNVGLSDWITNSEEQYVSRAVRAAGEVNHLAQVRAALRNRMTNSPLMNGPRFALNVESAYRTAWGRWCDQNRTTGQVP